MSENTNTNKKQNSYVISVSKEIKKDYGETQAIMDSIKENYNLTYSEIAVNKLAHFSGKELDEQAKQVLEKKERKYNYAIKKIAESTGWTKEYTTAEVERIEKEFHITVRTYWLRELYKKTDEEIAQYKVNAKKKKDERIKKIMEITDWSREKIENHIAYCNMNFGVHSIEYYSNFKCWELSDDQLRTFAVDEDSRKLSKLYNKKPVVLNNKLRFNNTFAAYLGRKFWTNKDTSFEEFQVFTKGLDKVFCKPLTLSMGVGTKIVTIPNTEDELKQVYNDLMKDNELLAEEFIVQHEKMNEMYAGCVNTVRFTMLREKNTCHRLWSFVRFGSTGIVDNFHGGGMAAAVDVNTGIIISDAMNSEGKFFSHHPVSGLPFKGFQIPHWDIVLEVTEQAMRSQNYVNYVGWDVAICPDGVVIVEGNATPQVGVYQAILAPSKIGQKPIYERFLNAEPAKRKRVPKDESLERTTKKETAKPSFLTRAKRKIKKILNK